MYSIAIGDEGKVNVNSKEAYLKYKNSHKGRYKVKVRTQRAYAQLIKQFYQEIGEQMVESEGGVFIDNFGYFTIMQMPFVEVNKTPYKNQDQFYNFHSNHKTYAPMFIPIAKNKTLLNLWGMDRTFSRRKVKAPLAKAIKGKKQYKTFMATLFSLYKFKK